MTPTIHRGVLTQGQCYELMQSFEAASPFLAGPDQAHKWPCYIRAVENLSALQAVHELLRQHMMKWIGCDVRSASTFVRSYQRGAFLHDHTDIGVGVLNAGICISVNPTHISAKQWPLIVEDKPYHVEIGDVILWLGGSRHMRPSMPAEIEEYTVALFHYYRKEI